MQTIFETILQPFCILVPKITGSKSVHTTWS